MIHEIEITSSKARRYARNNFRRRAASFRITKEGKLFKVSSQEITNVEYVIFTKFIHVF